MSPAGFARRCVAWSLDASAVGLVALLVCRRSLREGMEAAAMAWSSMAETTARQLAGWVDAAAGGGGTGTIGVSGAGALLRAALADPGLRAAAGQLQAALFQLVAPPLAAFVALFLCWCVGFERSPLRATPGKRALRLQVADAQGGAAASGKLLLRFLAGTLSWLSLNIGHMMAALPPSFTALHDRVSGTRVHRDAGIAAHLPGWARAWLAMLCAALLLAGARLALWMSAGLQAALERALYAYG